MSGSTSRLAALAAVLMTVAACSDINSTSGNTIELTPAFQTVPLGFSANTNSFDASGDAGAPFLPGSINAVAGFHGGPGPSGGEGEKHGRGGDRHDGFGGGGIRGLLMGGGLGPDFIGAIAFGKGRGRGPFGIFKLPDSCVFDGTSGRVNCADRTERDLTVKASFAFKDDAGTPQAKFDTITTNSVNVKIEVSGTKTRKEGVTSTVQHSSDRTVEGLAPGKTERKMNGVASAHETITGTKDDVAFTAVRDVNDTTRNFVIPIVDGRPTIATSGTVIRNMKVAITPDGGETTTKTRREEITFDGTNVVSVKITQDGTTKNCTITLPGKRLICEE